MFGLFDKISNWFRGLLLEGILSNFTGMFEEVNSKVREIAEQVGQTPQGWNGSIFSLIRTLSETVIIPVAGMILTFVLCYELITMVIEKNNMADFDTFIIYKWIFKTFVAVFILTHTFDIVMGVFSLAQHVVNGSAGIIGSRLDMSLALDQLQLQLVVMGTGELIGLFLESMILSLAMKAISLCVFIVIYGRMIEIYLTCSIAPIPFSTMVNREWGHIGNSYLKSLFALAFQGFLIMVCVAIYAILLQTITAAGNIHAAIWGCAGYTVLLCFTLFKTGSLSKSIFGAH
ncbi:MAG: hypothetical protein LBN02_00500 [Oscillospiraceae bacterium]|jgi:hypothetical protein|nr:hypothetical protein [Oscillospiraceae bacterium]